MILRAIIIIMSLLHAAYMVFDGMRAFIVGDYVRPSSGKYAGQLGPWANIVERIGLDPMSPVMKSIFVILGLYGLFAAGAFAFNRNNGWTLIVIFCVATLWNLMFGTMSSILVLLLLFIYKMK
ncbi:hypothetical protein [Polluticoccus soli]|uniref:hypothetical protein n=1 Tax=Polluticoccus soli TaxID=3034150 RepID=UPI0023E2D65A|nr:hypothetical protein [Flavipsychrobacter sp. JY13-12]